MSACAITSHITDTVNNNGLQLLDDRIEVDFKSINLALIIKIFTQQNSSSCLTLQNYHKLTLNNWNNLSHSTIIDCYCQFENNIIRLNTNKSLSNYSRNQHSKTFIAFDSIFGTDLHFKLLNITNIYFIFIKIQFDIYYLLPIAEIHNDNKSITMLDKTNIFNKYFNSQYKSSQNNEQKQWNILNNLYDILQFILISENNKY
eukprot:265718_1